MLTLYFLGKMRILKRYTHEKSSSSHIPFECQAKAHVGFHLSNIGDVRGSFQRGKSFKKSDPQNLFKVVKHTHLYVEQ